MPHPSLSVVADESRRPRADELPRAMPTENRAWHQRLIVHAGAYLVLLAAITIIWPLEASLTTDDGAYGGQVYALQQGAWELERPLPVVADANEGWANAAISPDGPLPYTTNPSYAVLLRLSADAIALVTGSEPQTAGDNALGLQLIPVLGALGAATIAWLLTAQWNRRVAALAFWLVGLGPTLVNATSLWAHTLSSALAGAALWALVKLLSPRPHRSWSSTTALIATFGLALTGAAVVRTESVFWIASLCLAVAVIYRSPRAIIITAFGGGLSAAAWLGNHWWGLSIRSDRLPIDNGVEAFEGGWLQSRIPAGWELLLTSLGSGAAVIPLVVAVVVVGYAGFKVRAGHPPRSVVPMLAAVIVLYAVMPIIAPGQFLAGMITATPVVFFLLGATARRRPTGDAETVASAETGAEVEAGGRQRAERQAQALFIGSSVGFIILVLATQYASSGGLQWGGRYLSMAYVPLAVVAALRAEILYRQLRYPLLVMLLVPTTIGMLTSRSLHENHEAVIDVITEFPAEVVITDQSPLPRLAWPALPTTVYLADPATAEDLITDLAAAGVETINIWGLDSLELDEVAGYEMTARNRHITHLERKP